MHLKVSDTDVRMIGKRYEPLMGHCRADTIQPTEEDKMSRVYDNQQENVRILILMSRGHKGSSCHLQ